MISNEQVRENMARNKFTATCPRCDWAVSLPIFEMAGTALREHTGTEHPRTRSFVSEKYVEPEPPPTVNDHPHIQDLVVEDIKARKVQGIAKYGTALQGFNGRDALTDAYQEALDLVQYLRQTLYERDLK